MQMNTIDCGGVVVWMNNSGYWGSGGDDFGVDTSFGKCLIANNL